MSPVTGKGLWIGAVRRAEPTVTTWPPEAPAVELPSELSLSRVERQEVTRAQNYGARHVQDVEAAAPRAGRVFSRQLFGLAVDIAQGVARQLPSPPADIVHQPRQRPTELGTGHLSAEDLQPQRFRTSSAWRCVSASGGTYDDTRGTASVLFGSRT